MEFLSFSIIGMMIIENIFDGQYISVNQFTSNSFFDGSFGKLLCGSVWYKKKTELMQIGTWWWYVPTKLTGCSN